MNFTSHALQRLSKRYGNYNEAQKYKMLRALSCDTSYKLIRVVVEGIEVREINIDGISIHAIIDVKRNTVITVVPTTNIASVESNATESNNAVKIFILEKTVNALKDEIIGLGRDGVNPINNRFNGIEQQLEAIRKRQKEFSIRLSENENGYIFIRFIKGFFSKRKK